MSSPSIRKRCICTIRRLRPAYSQSRTSVRSSRRQSSSSSTDPKDIAEAFLSKFSKGQIFTRTQLLDANQLRLFSLTLNRSKLWPGQATQSRDLAHEDPAAGTPLPPGYHLAYFTPAQVPGILGLDGTDASFNPDFPFTRRMWAGGSVHWPNSSHKESTNHHLRVGDTATELTTVLTCEPKVIKRTGESMLLVGVEKEFRDSKDNLCVLDRRNWVFRRALDPSKQAVIPVKPALQSESELAKFCKGQIEHIFNRDIVQLFRFSAVTFNGHRIHYDKSWAVEVEGHRNVVVHGPMNLVSTLDIWRDEAVKHGLGSHDQDVIFPKQIEYRVTSPVYAGEGYRILMDKDFVGKAAATTVLSDDGTTCMKATIQDW